jgi:septum site-determining protein MinD
MIVAVTGGKGGVGKSTLALNLADRLDAVLVDADLEMADLPRSRGPDLHDVLADRAAPLEAVRPAGPVRLLPCGRTLAGASAADPTALEGVLRAVERAHGAVVVDCPAGLRSDAGVPLLVAGSCVLVTRPTRSALSDAVRARELARVLDAGLAAVALNRTRRTEADRVATLLGAPTTCIPPSPPLARATAAGLPVFETAPESAAARRLAGLGDRVHSAVSSR